MADGLNLLPCPFCGGAAHIDDHHDDRDNRVIACQDCGANVGANCLTGGFARWNRRATPPAPSTAPSDELQNWLNIIHDNELSMGDRLQRISSMIHLFLQGDSLAKYPRHAIREQCACRQGGEKQ